MILDDLLHKLRFLINMTNHVNAYKFREDYTTCQDKNRENSRCLKFLQKSVKILDTCQSKTVIRPTTVLLRLTQQHRDEHDHIINIDH